MTLHIQEVITRLASDTGIRRRSYSYDAKQIYDLLTGIAGAKLSWKGQVYSTDGIEPLLNEIVDWAILPQGKNMTINHRKGILLKGPTGCGKTLLMSSLASMLSELNMQYRSNTRELPMTMSIISTRAMAEQFARSGYEALEAMVNEPILCMDDIGSEPELQSNFGTKVNIVNEVIDRRYMANLLTFGTTNLDKFDAAHGYDDRILRRMREMFNIRTMAR